MSRNLYERCEVTFPVTAPELVKRLEDEILGSYLKDNVKARVLGPEGEYTRAARHGAPFAAQRYLMELASEPPKLAVD